MHESISNFQKHRSMCKSMHKSMSNFQTYKSMPKKHARLQEVREHFQRHTPPELTHPLLGSHTRGISPPSPDKDARNTRRWGVRGRCFLDFPDTNTRLVSIIGDVRVELGSFLHFINTNKARDDQDLRRSGTPSHYIYQYPVRVRSPKAF